MGIREIGYKVWSKNILFTALVELTYRCNLECSFCYNDRNLRGSPLSVDQYFRFFEDLRDMGVLNLVLSGGEPLAHPAFFRLGSKARELGFVVRIKSNGHALRREMIQRIQDEVDPFCIDISLHGATPVTHDRMTGVAGSFRRLRDNLQQMSRLRLRYRLNVPLTAWNEYELEAMFALAEELGVGLNVDPSISPRDDGDRSPMSLEASPAAKQRALELAARQAERAADPDGVAAPAGCVKEAAATILRPDKLCGTGSSTIAVDPLGNVLPCVQWRRTVGNLHQDSIQDIWQRSAALREVRNLARVATDLADGAGPRGFCLGLAEALTGDPLRRYSRSDRRHQEDGEISG